MIVKVTANPDPFSAELAVCIHSSIDVNLVLRLINSNGTVIRVKGCPLHAGVSRITLKNLVRYATGRYFLEIKLLNGDLVESIQLAKQ